MALPVLPEKYQRIGFRIFPQFKSPDSWMEVVGTWGMGIGDFEICIPASKMYEIGYDRVDQYGRELENWLFSLLAKKK